MSPFSFAILFFLIGAFWWVIHLCRTTQPPQHNRKLLPGPWGLPIIGHLHMLGKLPHRSLYKLSQKYGPIMSLRLGSVPTVVVSSPATAELFLKTHDSVFASRPKTQAGELIAYGNKGMAFTEYGAHWRSLKKFFTLELLSAAKIDSMAGLRREELGLLVESLKTAAAACDVVDVSEKVARLIEDMTCRMLFGESRDERFDLNEIIHELSNLFGSFNIADYVPILGAIDLQGLVRKFELTRKALDKIFETIIDEHEQDACNGDKKMDFVDVILSVKNNPTDNHEQLSKNMDRSTIKAIILDMIFGAVDTSQTSIEWIMSELIRNPRVMKQLQEEVKSVVGDVDIVEELHLQKLDYLDMVVKETMRLHPVGPLIVPRESMEDIVIDGYYIPKKSRIMINIWGIGRDPKIWSENVEEFLPERFIGSTIDLRGQNFELIPFGSGRRGCPGIRLGIINIKLVVAQLVHSFNWNLPFGMSVSELNMDECFGLTVPRAEHLLAIPRLRP